MNSADAPGNRATLAALYRETIRRHSTEPCGYGRSIDPTHAHEGYNALCGDRVVVQLRVQADSVADAAFEGEACAICLASASLLCLLVPGEPVARLLQLASNLSEALGSPVGGRLRPNGPSAASAGDGDGAISPEAKKRQRNAVARGLLQFGDTHLPEDLQALLGVRPYPSRVRCATLPWEAAVAALGED